MNSNIIDDGSLSCLQIERNPLNTNFHCQQIKQSLLTDKSFWIIDYVDNIKTRHGQDRVVVMIGKTAQAKESECRKFFSNSCDIKYILGKLRELNKFPRKVTLRKNEVGGYYFE